MGAQAGRAPTKIRDELEAAGSWSVRTEDEDRGRNANLDHGALLTGIGGPGAVLSTPFTHGETEAGGGGSLWRTPGGAAISVTRVHGVPMCQGRTGKGTKPVTRTPGRGSLCAQRAQKRAFPRALAPSTPSGGSGLAWGWERVSCRGLEELGKHLKCGAPRGHDYTPGGRRRLMICRPRPGNGAPQWPL